MTISHAMSLAAGGAGSARAADIASAIDTLAELDVSVTNVAPKGAPIPLVDLTNAGVRVGLGMDGQRDYWGPWGNGDMLERAYLLAYTQGFSDDHLIEHALAVATWGGASVIDAALPRLDTLETRRGTDVGDPADLVVVRGDTPTAAVMDRDLDRIVIHRGRVVAEGGALV
ncbi:hypothetical protein GCM10025867_05620 [Frondihabitans sucicola]|uniref:Amidohydrolase 3 domain-containing protein n=1 Tax=Frondihabitans sucicola TaxID=1268041 RepID=A0ABM8GIY4_9MICO|nr:hypothetical protein GCM10025867_05620 [Frondihabitans sucicola]